MCTVAGKFKDSFVHQCVNLLKGYNTYTVYPRLPLIAVELLDADKNYIILLDRACRGK